MANETYSSPSSSSSSYSYISSSLFSALFPTWFPTDLNDIFLENLFDFLLYRYLDDFFKTTSGNLIS